MILLFDLDDVAFEWSEHLDSRLDTWGAPAALIPRTPARRSFDLFGGLSAAEAGIMRVELEAPGFYAALRPAPGAIRAIHHLVELGHVVRFVSTPWWTNAACASEKVLSVAHHFGEDFRRRTFLVPDKTAVRGDILFDDKPVIKGDFEPEWTRVYFDRPWNQPELLREEDRESFRLFDWDLDRLLAVIDRVGFQRAAA